MPPKNRVLDHPGKILVEEFMKPLDLSGHALALELHVPASRISGIINGQRAVSADTALRLARYFGKLTEVEMDDFDAFCLKATADERIDEGLRLAAIVALR
jgi:addiction module HigA family antidote